MKIIAVLVLTILVSACAPLIVGGVVGYEIGHHHKHFPMGVHR